MQRVSTGGLKLDSKAAEEAQEQGKIVEVPRNFGTSNFTSNHVTLPSGLPD
jgi:hypothetical protein